MPVFWLHVSTSNFLCCCCHHVFISLLINRCLKINMPAVMSPILWCWRATGSCAKYRRSSCRRNERELFSGVSIVTLLPRPVQLMLYLTMAEKTSVGGCHVMLMYWEPMLVMVMFVGYAANEQGNSKYNCNIMWQSLDQRERERERETTYRVASGIWHRHQCKYHQVCKSNSWWSSRYHCTWHCCIW